MEEGIEKNRFFTCHQRNRKSWEVLGFFSEWIKQLNFLHQNKKKNFQKRNGGYGVLYKYTKRYKKCALGITKDNVLEFYHRRPSTGLSSYGFAEIKQNFRDLLSNVQRL